MCFEFTSGAVQFVANHTFGIKVVVFLAVANGIKRQNNKKIMERGISVGETGFA